MNRIYRLVWNAAKGINQVASEKSRSQGKGKRGIKRPRLATLLLLSSPAAFAGGAGLAGHMPKGIVAMSPKAQNNYVWIGPTYK